MFVQAIEKTSAFTRPIFSVLRNYKSTLIQPIASTLFFVNKLGYALTCKHVAELIINADNLGKKRGSFKKEFETQRGSRKEKHIIKDLEKKYGYTSNTPFELLNRFVGCVDGDLDIEVTIHPSLDIAIIKFNNFKNISPTSFPFFPKDSSKLKPGKYLCRLGFPFPEFKNYSYDADMDKIVWTEDGQTKSPRFPIEGMLTRFLSDVAGNRFGFELSTPGLRGQSGGPAFDEAGLVWGIQFATKHLDLDFDVDQEVLRNGVIKKVKDSAFLHVGLCIHVEQIRKFLTDNKVDFEEI